jgi:hypothetical protein
MFTKNSVSQSMIDAVQSVLAEDKKLLLEPGKKKETPPFDGPYKKPDTKPGHGDASRVKHLAKMAIPKGEVEEELKGNQGVLDKNHNGKLDKKDFELLRMKKEEVEELDELSKKTLGSYAKKATRDAVISRKIGADFEHQGNRAKSPGMKAASNELSQKYKVKSWKRRDGVDKAVDRLTKEDYELDEAINDNMHPAGVSLLKHIKPEHHNLYKPHLTTDTFDGSFRDRHDVLTAAKQAGHLKEDIGGISTISEKKKKDEAIRVDTLKGPTISNDPEVKIANAHFSGKSATLKAEGKGTETPSTFVTDSATHREINKAVRPTFKKIKEMLGKTGTSEEKNEK